MTTLYEKRGRRYHPVAEMFSLDSLPIGIHLVTVQAGLQTVTYNVNPDHASLIAASRDAKAAMCAAMHRAMAREPVRPLTSKQRKIMDQFVAAGGFPVFSRKSALDVVDAGIAALIAASTGRAADAVS
jgi:hypothetical protein